MTAYHHRESDMQIRCVKWFRITYPEFAYLLFHPHNEGNAFNRRQQAIANAEGVKDTWHDIDAERTAEAKRELEKLINKK